MYESPRHRELEHAMTALGLRPTSIICGGLPDGGLDRNDVQQRLRWLLATHADAATALCLLGPEGVYGHRDHTAVWRAVVGLCGADASTPRRLVWPVFPEGDRLFAPLRGYLSRVAPQLLDPATPTAPPPHTVVSVPLPAHIQARKRAAIAAHKSQLPKGDLNLFLGRGVVDILSANETYAIAEAAQ